MSFRTPGGVYNATPSRIVFGLGSISGLADEVRRLGATRALVVSTAGRVELARDALSILGPLGVGLHPEAISQVPMELAERGRARTRELDADCLVTIGGGAATGLGKGIALELGIPIVAVPTTYCGSEMTGFCGITISGVKRMHTSLNMLPSTVIYDAELSKSLPAAVSASSAFNALAHCVDSIYLPTISPLLRHAAVEGAATVAEFLPRVLDEPSDVESRQQMHYGAFLAGASLTGGFSLQHTVAHVLGGSFGIQHGLAHAIVLPHVTAYLQTYVGEALRPIADALLTDDLPGAIFDLLAATGIPTSLAADGMTRDDLARAVEIVIETRSEGVDSGLPVTAEAVSRILDDAFAGLRPPATGR